MAISSRFFKETLNLAESMKGYSLRLTFGCAVIALGILTSCSATTTLPTRLSEIRDRNNLRDDQQAVPRANNAAIEP